jgi:hypothetical protein
VGERRGGPIRWNRSGVDGLEVRQGRRDGYC